jgi:hypothetical protein
MKKLDFADVERAADWGLAASFLEEKAGGSALAAICQAGCERRGFDDRMEALLRWALDTGAKLKSFEGQFGALFQLATCPGAAKAWGLFLGAGCYDGAGRMVAKAAGAPEQGRTSSKLGLLCCPPYCWGPELPELIGLLAAHGADPNERDSEGVSPLGRLNDELKHREAAGAHCSDSRSGLLIRGAQALLECGARPESILPALDSYAAQGLRACLGAKIERDQLLEEVIVPEPEPEAPRGVKAL